MPREIVKKPRFIYPQIATSLSIAEVSALAELLFWRLLPQADDQGRLPGDPRQLKAITCPMREELSIEKIPEFLDELEKAKLIIHYSNSSTDCIQLAKWWDYQAGMRHAYPSQYPPPKGWQDQVKGAGVGKMPQNGAQCGPEPELGTGEPEQETGTGNSKPEPEEGTTTPTAETATEFKTSETHEYPERVTETAEESKMLGFLETLEGWRFGRAEDIVWLRDFRQERPDFSLAFARACRDYHSGREKVKHKGVWKNRFRNWLLQHDDFEKKKGGANGKGVKDKRGKVHPRQDFSGGKW